jgi:hypothetical protein
VSLLSGRLISEVDMEVWPGFKGTVVTTAAISPLPPASLELQVGGEGGGWVGGGCSRVVGVMVAAVVLLWVV